MDKIVDRKLSRICAQLVKQGPSHKQLMTEYFAKLVEAARNEFAEDNKPTLDAFLRECFEDSLKV